MTITLLFSLYLMKMLHVGGGLNNSLGARISTLSLKKNALWKVVFLLRENVDR